jgi:hypothetical protein
MLRLVESARQNRMNAERNLLHTHEMLQAKNAEVLELEVEAARLHADHQMLIFRRWKMQKFHRGLDMKIAKMEREAEEGQKNVEVERQQSWKMMEARHMNAVFSCNDMNALKFGRTGWKRKKSWSKKRKQLHQLGTAEMFEEGNGSLESHGREWKKKAVEFDSEMMSWIKNRRENESEFGKKEVVEEGGADYSYAGSPRIWSCFQTNRSAMPLDHRRMDNKFGAIDRVEDSQESSCRIMSTKFCKGKMPIFRILSPRICINAVNCPPPITLRKTGLNMRSAWETVIK